MARGLFSVLGGPSGDSSQHLNAYGIGQPHRHFTAEQLAPRAEVRRDWGLGMSAVQEIQSPM